MTNKLISMGLVAAACCWSQQLDLSSLDKLEAKAKSVNRVNLDASQLHNAFTFFDSDDVPKDVLNKVKTIQVRNLEFANKGAYSFKDLDGIRKQVADIPGCSKVIDSKEDEEQSEIYVCSGEKMRGIAIISAEPKELSVVFVRGVASLGDLGTLHGLMGVPKPEPPPPPPNVPPPPKDK